MCGPKECVPLVVQRLRLVVSPEEFREDSRLNCEAQRVFTISGKLANLEGVIDLGEGLPDVPLQKLDRRQPSVATLRIAAVAAGLQLPKGLAEACFRPDQVRLAWVREVVLSLPVGEPAFEIWVFRELRKPVPQGPQVCAAPRMVGPNSGSMPQQPRGFW